MIKISDWELYYTINLLKIVERCRSAHVCLWFERKALLSALETTKYKPCLKDDCPIVIFRKKIELGSPLFYAQSLELLQINNILKRAVKIFETKQGSSRQRRRRYLRKLEEIKNFDHLFVLAIYPLSLKMAKAPSLEYKELVELTNTYNSIGQLQILQELAKINHNWCVWVYNTMCSLTSDNDNYSTIIFYLIYLYVKGLEKSELPDLKNMPPQQKHDFFEEITEEISPTAKRLKLIRVLQAILNKKLKTD